jgi:hypothetical protein
MTEWALIDMSVIHAATPLLGHSSTLSSAQYVHRPHRYVAKDDIRLSVTQVSAS